VYETGAVRATSRSFPLLFGREVLRGVRRGVIEVDVRAGNTFETLKGGLDTAKGEADTN
jgi:hypothetical protein